MTSAPKHLPKASAKSRFHASILGSLRQLAHGGSDGACWSTQNGKMQEILGMHIQGCDSQSAIAILGQAVLKSARVIEYSSSFPFAIGVQISCVPNQEVTSTGSSYAFTALPATTNSVPMTIYENDATTAESMAWRAQYPEYNAANLETQGVLNVQGEGFVFVSKTHPVIDLLRANKDVLNADIDSQPLIDDQWVRAPVSRLRSARRAPVSRLRSARRAPLTRCMPQLKVTKQVLSTCCNQIKTKVLNKVGTCDLSNITVQISRLDGQWSQMTADDALFKCIPEELTVPVEATDDSNSLREVEEAQRKRTYEFSSACHAILNKQRSFHLRFELEFDLIPQAIV
jgi:hypothetical protein